MNASVNSFTEYQAGIWMRRIIYPSFIVLGTIGNILSVIVLTRKRIWKSITAVYLVTLAFTDIFVLYTGLLRRWILVLFAIDVRHTHSAICKIHYFLSYFSIDFSGWILVAVTFERVVLVWFPYSAKTKCSRRTAIFVLILLAVFIALLNGHLVYGFGDKIKAVGNETHVEFCKIIDDSYMEFILIYFHWIDLAKYSIAPFVFLLVGNTLIIIKLLLSRRNIKSSRNESVSDKPSKRRISSLTRMLFALNTVYFISSVPISIYLLGFEMWIDINDPHGQAINYLCWTIFTVLMYGNNTFNFLLYCFSGKKFRTELMDLQCRRTPDPKIIYKERGGSKSPPSVNLHM